MAWMGTFIFLALVCLFVGLFVPGVKWMIIVGAVLVVVSLISGFMRANELA